MEERSLDGWRWSNVPIPEPHVVGLLLGVLLHRVRPRSAVGRLPGATVVGWSLVGWGLLVIGWCVWTVGDVETDAPTEVVSTGPYAYSRNPMYVAWTGIYTGVALVVNSLWLVLLLPVVLATTHVTIKREERALERTFSETYQFYRRTVPRYF